MRLVLAEKWVRGDRRYGAIHRGKTYLFSGPQEQQQFLAEPDRFSPALSGNDPVQAIDQGAFVPGQRAHGLFFDKRVYLFSSESSIAAFYRDPGRYAEGVRQAEAVRPNATMYR